MIVILFFTQKSPKWLLDNGHIEEAMEVLTTIGRTNGVLSKDEVYQQSLKSKEYDDQELSESFINDFWRDPVNL